MGSGDHLSQHRSSPPNEMSSSSNHVFESANVSWTSGAASKSNNMMSRMTSGTSRTQSLESDESGSSSGNPSTATNMTQVVGDKMSHHEPYTGSSSGSSRSSTSSFNNQRRTGGISSRNPNRATLNGDRDNYDRGYNNSGQHQQLNNSNTRVRGPQAGPPGLKHPNSSGAPDFRELANFQSHPQDDYRNTHSSSSYNNPDERMMRSFDSSEDLIDDFPAAGAKPLVGNRTNDRYGPRNNGMRGGHNNRPNHNQHQLKQQMMEPEEKPTGPSFNQEFPSLVNNSGSDSAGGSTSVWDNAKSVLGSGMKKLTIIQKNPQQIKPQAPPNPSVPDVGTAGSGLVTSGDSNGLGSQVNGLMTSSGGPGVTSSAAGKKRLVTSGSTVKSSIPSSSVDVSNHSKSITVPPVQLATKSLVSSSTPAMEILVRNSGGRGGKQEFLRALRSSSSSTDSSKSSSSTTSGVSSAASTSDMSSTSSGVGSTTAIITATDIKREREELVQQVSIDSNTDNGDVVFNNKQQIDSSGDHQEMGIQLSHQKQQRVHDDNQLKMSNSNLRNNGHNKSCSSAFLGLDEATSSDSILSSSLEAEQRLLKEMGWREEDDDDFSAPLTEDEVKEFKDLIVSRNGFKQQNTTQTSNGPLLSSSSTTTNRITVNTNWNNHLQQQLHYPSVSTSSSGSSVIINQKPHLNLASLINGRKVSHVTNSSSLASPSEDADEDDSSDDDDVSDDDSMS